MVRISNQYLFISLASLLSFSLHARGTYQDPGEFLNEVFDNHVPKAQFIWLTGNIGKDIKTILQHPPRQLRVRYWTKNKTSSSKSAWILEETGKEKPITVGIVIENNQITHLKILRFLESRGDEVRHDFFTEQFRHAQLHPNLQLDKPIDGISGATLSVRAVTKLARVALYLNTLKHE